MPENKFNSFIHFGDLADQAARRDLAESLYDRLRGASDVPLNLSHDETRNFSSGLEDILNNDLVRELCADDPSLSEKITEEILDFITKTQKVLLQTENPLAEEEELLSRFQDLNKDDYEKVLEDLAPSLKERYSKNELNPDYCCNEMQKILTEKTENIKISFEDLKNYFFDKWGGLLKQKQIQRELEIIDEQRRLFFQELYKRLEDLKKLRQILDPFTGELGRLWDMSKGRWQKAGFDLLKKYADLLEKDKPLQELAETLGRARQAEQEWEEEIFTELVERKAWQAEPAGKAEVVGLHESDDLSAMLPAEAAYLAAPGLELVFYKKFAEKKLQTFQFQAPQAQKESLQKTRPKAKERIKGPFIICVDTSGSMHGTPETVAKTLCFALLKIAIRDKRECFLISFSTGLQVLSLKEFKYNLDKLMEFLAMSFHGGTDAEPALHKALEMLETKDYEKADVIMVSDFVMPALGDEIKRQIAENQKKGTKFHSLTIGASGSEQVAASFDHNWLYKADNQDGIISLMKANVLPALKMGRP